MFKKRRNTQEKFKKIINSELIKKLSQTEINIICLQIYDEKKKN